MPITHTNIIFEAGQFMFRARQASMPPRRYHRQPRTPTAHAQLPLPALVELRGPRRRKSGWALEHSCVAMAMSVYRLILGRCTKCFGKFVKLHVRFVDKMSFNAEFSL